MADPAPIIPSMTSSATPSETGAPDPTLILSDPIEEIDQTTIIGLVVSLALIIVAVWMGQSQANFFNLPSVFIVILGTLAVTAISYTSDELSEALHIIKGSVVRLVPNLTEYANTLMGISVIAKKRGLLTVTNHDTILNKNEFLKQSMQLVADGFLPQDIEFFLTQEIQTSVEKHKAAASVLRRASEIAPGMGLIGTLVGLVQMLSQLNSPETIGPAMAVALLTTFYGAIMGTVVLAPLAAKVERNANEDMLLKNLIITGATSMARQENPRRLEILLNSLLPERLRIRYFN
jgi:chemotaxis protein MotA